MNENIAYALMYLTIAPLRVEPNHRSEMSSQVLFGEALVIKKYQDDWAFVEIAQDTYQGWIEKSQLTVISKEYFEKYQSQEKVKLVSDFWENQKLKLRLIKGSTLPSYQDQTFTYKNSQKVPIKTSVIKGVKDRGSLVETAILYLGAPYLWGGKTMMGIDCSGFSQIVYFLNGVQIARDASQQAVQGVHVPFLQEAQAGDLAFFDNEEGNITHVGILLYDGQIIHASHGRVKIDRIDQEGILNEELMRYTHKLRLIKSYL